ncbi:MAG: ATP-binding cassette domain-containing protein [Vicinamibacteria bacterium]
MAPAVVLEHLSKVFGSFRAVDDITFDVAEGEVFGFLGANGAGKSTTIRILCGLLGPSSGTAKVLGVDVARDPEEVKRRIGYMSQRFSLYDELTVADNLRFFGGVYGLRGSAARERERWAIEMAGLAGMESTRTGALAGGWKQRLALASAVLHRPRVVFLDEPTSGVDPLSRRRFWRLIDEMSQEGITVFVTTHYLDEAEHCERLALLHAGRLVALGTPAELKEVYSQKVILEVTAPRIVEALDTLAAHDWAHESSVFGDRIHVVVDGQAEGERRIRSVLEEQGIQPVSIVRIPPSLEDVFIHYVSGEPR